MAAIKKKPATGSNALLALTASALALTGTATRLEADTPPTQTSLSYRFSSYQEDDLDSDKLIVGSAERYDINIHQFRLVAPVGEKYALSLEAGYESMSGASPWFSARQSNGSAGVVMSGASISEQRRSLSLNGRRYLNNGSVALSLASSRENDYKSLSFGFDGERHFNNDLTTVAAGFSYSDDDIEPSDADLFNRVNHEKKNGTSIFFSLSQIINQTSLFQTAINISQLSGFLSDPYKLGDVRPDSKTQFAWSNAYRHFFIPLDAALQIDYRYYHDSFEIKSHTLELSWHQNFGNIFQLVPGVRYYSQSEADFFSATNNFALPDNIYQSSDYRLSSFRAISASLKTYIDIKETKVSFSAERYLTDSEHSKFKVNEESPSLVNYTRFSIGIEHLF